MILLALDTAAVSYGTALVEGGRLLAQTRGSRARTHARRIMAAVDQTLKDAGLAMEDVDGLAVTIGPGSFTGLRIGMATVLGLAAARNLRVAGVSTLAALAHPVDAQEWAIQPALDAKKGQVYTARFRRKGGRLIQETAESALHPEDWAASIDRETLFVGDGAALYEDLLQQRLGGRARFAPPECAAIQAASVAALGLGMFQEDRAVRPQDLRAVYVRQSDARLPVEKPRKPC